MSHTESRVAPAGWYPDPTGAPQLRWWNSHSWTEQTSAIRQPLIVQDAKFAWADEELPSRRLERERERTEAAGVKRPEGTADVLAHPVRELEAPRAFAKIEQTPAARTPTDKWWADPQGAEKRRAAAAAARHATAPRRAEQDAADPDLTNPGATEPDATNSDPTGPGATTARATEPVTARVDPTAATPRSSTGPAWIIALVPLLQLVVSLLLVSALGGAYDLRGAFLGIVVLPYVVVVVFAVLDYRALRLGGFRRPASWAFALLTAPVYLVLRARATLRESGQGVGPVLVWFAFAVLQLASIVAIPGILIAAAPTFFAHEIESSVEYQATIAGGGMTVTCPTTPPVVAGQEIECATVADDGTASSVVVTLARTNGWIAWQVADWGVYSRSTAD